MHIRTYGNGYLNSPRSELLGVFLKVNEKLHVTQARRICARHHGVHHVVTVPVLREKLLPKL